MNHHRTLDSVLLNFIKTCDSISTSSTYPSFLMFSFPFICSQKGRTPFHCFLILISHPPLHVPFPPATFGPIPKTYPVLSHMASFPTCFLPATFSSCCLRNTCSAVKRPYVHSSPSCSSFTAIAFLIEDMTYLAVFTHGSLTFLVGKEKIWLFHCPVLRVDIELPPFPGLSQDVRVISL